MIIKSKSKCSVKHSIWHLTEDKYVRALLRSTAEWNMLVPFFEEVHLSMEHMVACNKYDNISMGSISVSARCGYVLS